MKLVQGRYFNYILILILAFVLYGNTIKNRYAMDDEFVIRQNELVQKGVTAIPEIFSTPYYQSKNLSFGYRPLTKAMYALEYEIFGENPAVNHFMNVLLYAICCILLFSLFKKYFNGLVSELFWLITIILFMAHPVHTEVVASLKNREEILCCLFSLAGMWMLLELTDSKKIISFAAGFICFTLAFFAKQSAVIFLFIVPATYFLRTLIRKEKLKPAVFNYRLWVSVASILVLTYIFYKIPQWFMPAEKVDLLNFENPLHTSYTLQNKILLALYSFWFYFRISLIPHPLLYYYGLNTVPEPSFTNISTFLGIASVAFTVYYAIKKYKTNPLITYGITIFIFGLAPFMNILIPINGIVAERMVFFPLFGFSVISSVLMFSFSKNIPSDKKLNGKNSGMVWFVFAAVMLLYSVKTISRNSDWKDSVTLYSADMPFLDESVKANDIYATAVFDEIYKQVTAGRTVKDMNAKLEDVIKKYKRTLELFPENPKAHHNLSTIYLSFFSDAQNGLLHAYKAKKMDPENFKVYFNIGQAYHLLKKTDSAEFYYRRTYELNRNFNKAWEQIIRLYSESGDPAKLKPYTEEYNKLFPESDLALAALGTLYISQRDTLNGIACFEKAIAISPQVSKEKVLPIYKYYLLHNDSAKAAYYAKMMN